MVLKLPQGNGDCEYVFSFEIGQWEGVFIAHEQTDGLDRMTDGPCTILVYRYTRETPAFGGISLTLRGCGAFGAPVAPPLGKPLPSAAVKVKK